MTARDILSEPKFGELPEAQTKGLQPPPPPPLDPEYVRFKQSGVSQPEDAAVRTRVLQRDLPLLLDGDFLKVTNHDGARHQVFRWARKTYVVAPKGEGLVLFEALVNHLGDPRSQENAVTKYSDGQGDRGIILTRHDEITRLFALYGVKNERMEDGYNAQTQEMEEGLLTLAPKVSVETLSGDRVAFPALRPDMLPFPVQNVDPQAVNSDTTRMFDQVASENADLRAQLERLEARLDDALRQREGLDPEGQ